MGKKQELKSEVIYIATFGRFGKEVNVECIKKEDGRYYETKNGRIVPEWATIRLK